MSDFCDEKKRKLNYTIHNPNTVEETVKVLVEVFVQANMGKVEKKLNEVIEMTERFGQSEAIAVEL